MEEEGVQMFTSERKFIIEFEDFEQENYENFVRQVNDSIDQPFRDLFLSSNGGNLFLVEPMKRILEKGDFSITGYSHLLSAGFILYMYTNVEKEILPGTTGAFHFPYYRNQVLNHDKTLHYHSKIDEIIMQKEAYNADFFQELLDITNAKRKKLEANLNEWLIYDDKKLRKLSEKSLKMLNR